MSSVYSNLLTSFTKFTKLYSCRLAEQGLGANITKTASRAYILLRSGLSAQNYGAILTYSLTYG